MLIGHCCHRWKRSCSAKECTASCPFGFWKDLEWELWCCWPYCQLPLDGVSHPRLTTCQVFLSHPCLADAGRGEGSLCLCRILPGPRCCRPNKTNKRPPSLWSDRTLLKEFAVYATLYNHWLWWLHHSYLRKTKGANLSESLMSFTS